MRKKKRICEAVCAAILAAVVLWSLLPARPAFSARMLQVPAESLPGFSDDIDCADLVRALGQSIAYYEKLPGDRRFDFGEDSYCADELAAGMRRFKDFVAKKPSADEINGFIRKNARVYRFEESSSPVRVLFTGYYEPILEGSRKRTHKFKYPVYSRPWDLVQVNLSKFGVNCSEKFIIGRYTGKSLVPYYDRRTIEKENVLESKADTIAWTDDPIELFFLHVQGSGRIKMQKGDILRVQYNVTNGRPYRSIGKYLIDKGKISRQEMSMQAIADYIRQNPSEMEDIFFYNSRYVFFEISQQGPRGSLGVELTAGRSLALDQKITPSGTLVFVSGKRPVCDKSGSIDRWESFSRFMCSQDAGSGIKGEKRADIFWGSGNYAETAAGYMKHRGELYFIVIAPDSESF
ncbi:MAG: murein transglycosylase A [Desulfosalsimonas sp.]